MKKRQVRLVALALMMSTIISIAFLIFAYFKHTENTRLKAELENCRSGH